MIPCAVLHALSLAIVSPERLAAVEGGSRFLLLIRSLVQRRQRQHASLAVFAAATPADRTGHPR